MIPTRSLMVLLLVCCLTSIGHALPVLQLGPGAVGIWNYNSNTQTWVTTSDSFCLNAFANSNTAGANGSFAWDPAGAADRYAYLVVSAIPMVNSDLFDISVDNDGGALSIFDAGFGTPPVQDDNSLAPHSIFDTYFEIYQFQFDGPLTTISNTQPGQSGTGDGYVEVFDFTMNGLIDPVYGIHMDLFTVEGSGVYDPSAPRTATRSWSRDLPPSLTMRKRSPSRARWHCWSWAGWRWAWSVGGGSDNPRR